MTSKAEESARQRTSFSSETVQAVGYATLAVVSVVVVARIAIQYARPRRIAAEDYWMAFAYILFVAQCILYIVLSPMRERVRQYTNGDIGPYPRLKQDAYLIGRLIFPALLFFWTILWSVKFGLLLRYRKLFAGLPGLYNRIWWFLVIFCAIALSGNYIAFLTSCETLGSFFGGGKKGGCNNRVRQFVSIWYSFAADTITNIMLIAFPWHLTWNLNMPRGQKSAIRVLFASGIVCIFIATLRAAQITANTIKTHATMDGTWLAVWGMAETAVAVIIGLCPSFAILIRATRKNNKKLPNDGVFSFHLPTIGSAPTRPKRKKDPNAIDSLWTNTQCSQEELAMKQDTVSVSTSAQHDEENFGVAR